MPSRFLTRTLPVFRALAAAARPALLAVACALALAMPARVALAAEGVNVKHGKTVVVEGGTFAFGTTDVGSTQVRNYSVTNTGGSAIDLAALSITGSGFSVRSEATSIQPGKKASIIVELDTASAGNRMATVNIPALGADLFDFKVTASVVNPSPRLLASSQGETIEHMGSLFIGNTIVGKTRTRAVTLRNSGALTLTLSEPVLEGSGFTLTSKPKTSLAPGKSTRFNIRLDGAEVGAKTGMVTITSNDSAHPSFKFIIDGSVGASGPDIAVNTPTRQIANNATVDLGSAASGLDIVVPIRIRNVGNAPLVLGDIELSNTDSFELSVPPEGTLSPGKSSTLLVTFLSSHGSAEGTLTIPSNDPDESPFVMNLSAIGEPSPDIELYIEASPNFFIEDNADFLAGSTEGNTQLVIPIKVRNAGTANLLIGTVVANPVGGGPALFVVTQQPPVFTLAPGEITEFRVTFTDFQGVEAVYRTDVSFSDNDPTENPFNFRMGVFVFLSAGGSRPAPGAASLLIDQEGRIVSKGGVFDFGSAFKGQPDTRDFTITNTGSTPLTLGAATLNGRGFTLLSQSDPAAPIPAGGSATLTVRMNADQVGPVAASLSVPTASGDLITFLLSGKVE